MARRVLLVDSDMDRLAALSAILGTRGFTVILADSVERALCQCAEQSPDIVLAAADVCEQDHLREALSRAECGASLPLLVLDDAAAAGGQPSGPHDEQERRADRVSRSDVEALLLRLVAAPPRGVPGATQGEVRGDLSQVPLIDLLQLLSMNRRTGTLSVTTASGAGEVRLSSGEVIDSVYRRLEGEKALYRLLGEREGSFVFLPGGEVPPRRVTMSTSMLVLEAMRQFDEVARRRSQLAPQGEALMAASSDAEGLSKLDSELLSFLQYPRSLDEVLDESQAPDLEILEGIERLSSRGVLLRIARSSMVTRLASEEGMQMLRALTQRLARDGFQGPPRLAIAGTSARLAMITSAVLRIEDTGPAHDSPPSLPLPHPIASVRFGDGVELTIVAWPLHPEYSPLWGLSLPGTAVVMMIDPCECEELVAACQAAEVRLLHSSDLLGDIEGTDPAQVAALLRVTLETVAGA